MAASLQMQQSMHAHQLELVTPAQVSMLLAQDEMNLPSPISKADPEAPHLTNFPPAGTPQTLYGDIPSPSGTVLTSNEAWRFWRAMYHIMLYCNQFPVSGFI
ncbi:hypothetical protein B0H14DRAFT_2583345 [Mycena olivaceomarginata]|nr:hypothetical protein B0H14DRAFT_2583345 [Mycena olivaceomarginata]